MTWYPDKLALFLTPIFWRDTRHASKINTVGGVWVLLLNFDGIGKQFYSFCIVARLTTDMYLITSWFPEFVVIIFIAKRIVEHPIMHFPSFLLCNRHMTVIFYLAKTKSYLRLWQPSNLSKFHRTLDTTTLYWHTESFRSPPPTTLQAPLPMAHCGDDHKTI